MPINVSTEDRLAIYDNAFRYAWALDTMDAETLASTFTSNGRCRPPAAIASQARKA